MDALGSATLILIAPAEFPHSRTSDQSAIARAGFPATVAPGETSAVTTAPAPTIARSPIVTPQSTVAPLPTLAPLFTTVGTTFQSASVCSEPFTLVARGYLSLMKVTLWPTKTSSSIVTPSQINVWLEILQFRPTRVPF